MWTSSWSVAGVAAVVAAVPGVVLALGGGPPPCDPHGLATSSCTAPASQFAKESALLQRNLAMSAAAAAPPQGGEGGGIALVGEAARETARGLEKREHTERRGEHSEERVHEEAKLEGTSNTALVRESHARGLDINQKVYFGDAPVLGDGVGESALNQCSEVPRSRRWWPATPKVTACGTGIKVTLYVRSGCESYYDHQKVLGSCDSGMPPESCESYSPNPFSPPLQSYKIERC